MWSIKGAQAPAMLGRVSKNQETSKIATCVETDTNVRIHEVTERKNAKRTRHIFDDIRNYQTNRRKRARGEGR